MAVPSLAFGYRKRWSTPRSLRRDLAFRCSSFNGQVKFLPPVEEGAREARRLKMGAYADHLSCAPPPEFDATSGKVKGHGHK
jgi:hypothetical protein